MQVLSGEGGAFLFRFLRTLIFARLTTVEDFGVAALFSLLIASVETVSQFGLSQLIVQRKDGDEERVQRGIQGISASRGLLSAAILYLLAGPIAGFFETEQAQGAIEALALSPLLLGLIHFDVFRLQRHRRFLPYATTFSVPVFLSLLMIWPLFLWFGDFRAMAAAIVIEAAMIAAASHLLADRRYRAGLDREIAVSGFRFGWPLLLSSVALFLVMHGEKVIVARELGPTIFGIFAMGLTLTLSPGLLFSRSLRALLLPPLARNQDRPEAFRPLSVAAIEATLFAGVIIAASVMGLGPLFVRLALGEKFAALTPLLPFFALVVMLHVSKTGPGMVSVALGRTTNPMFGNFGRIAALPVAWWAAATGHDLSVILFISALGEIVGLALALTVLCVRAGVRFTPLAPGLAIYGLVALGLALSCAGVALAPSEGPAHVLGWIILPPLAALAIMGELRGFCLRLLRGGRAAAE